MSNPSRTIVIAVLAVALLFLVVVATDNGSGTLPSPPSTLQPAPVPTEAVAGLVSTRIHHLSHATWEYQYLVHNTGTTTIAGFQINGRRANLFDLAERPHWLPFGSGVCGGSPSGILIYWSIGPGSASIIPPGATGHFSFRVNTSGTVSLLYALSSGQFHPQFGTVSGPAPSLLPAMGPCR
ncbi:MAG: hypothetical protein M3Z66_14940 [Chloroflexota bacterium]|nr:hypothetical protein [Chloroflexota bacterium]